MLSFSASTQASVQAMHKSKTHVVSYKRTFLMMASSSSCFSSSSKCTSSHLFISSDRGGGVVLCTRTHIHTELALLSRIDSLVWIVADSTFPWGHTLHGRGHAHGSRCSIDPWRDEGERGREYNIQVFMPTEIIDKVTTPFHGPRNAG